VRTACFAADYANCAAFTLLRPAHFQIFSAVVFTNSQPTANVTYGRTLCFGPTYSKVWCSVHHRSAEVELWQVTTIEYRQRHQGGRTMKTSGRTTRHGRRMIRKLPGCLYKSQYVCHWLTVGPTLPHSLVTSVSTLQIGPWDPEQQDKHVLK